jgi:hypothetical protein
MLAVLIQYNPLSCQLESSRNPNSTMLRLRRITLRRKPLLLGAALALATSIAIATHLVLFFRGATAALGEPLPAAPIAPAPTQPQIEHVTDSPVASISHSSDTVAQPNR